MATPDDNRMAPAVAYPPPAPAAAFCLLSAAPAIRKAARPSTISTPLHILVPFRGLTGEFSRGAGWRDFIRRRAVMPAPSAATASSALGFTASTAFDLVPALR